MTNKLVVIKSLKVTKIKKIVLYEKKFLVQIYSCIQNPWLGGLTSPDPRSYCPLSSTEFLEPPPPPPNKILMYATDSCQWYLRLPFCVAISIKWDVCLIFAERTANRETNTEMTKYRKMFSFTQRCCIQVLEVRFFTADIKYDLHMSNSSAIRPHTIVSTHLTRVAFQGTLFTANTEVSNTCFLAVIVLEYCMSVTIFHTAQWQFPSNNFSRHCHKQESPTVWSVCFYLSHDEIKLKKRAQSGKSWTQFLPRSFSKFFFVYWYIGVRWNSIN